jgi:hypothetical protein
MLPNTFVLFFAPAVLAAVVPGAQSQPKVTPFSKFPPSYFKGLDLSTLLMTGTKNDSSGIPVQQILPPVVFQQAIHKKIRYGPYKLPSTKKVNLQSVLLKDSGMMDSVLLAAMPCTDCTILFGDGGMEYANGTVANIGNGVMQHHTAILNTGKDVWWSACGLPMTLRGIDPFFGLGNEKTPAAYQIPGSSIKSGYYLAPDNKFILVNELMNMDEEEKEVYVTVNWEYVPGKPEGFKQAQDIWLDLGYCNPAGEDPPNDRAFNKSSIKWTSPYEGTILGIIGHMHDGGTNLRYYINDKLVCDSKAQYGQNSNFIERSNGRQGMNGMPHISSMSGCVLPGFLRKGDVIHVTAEYDFAKYKGMNDNTGRVGEIMGVGAMLLIPGEFIQDPGLANLSYPNLIGKE